MTIHAIVIKVHHGVSGFLISVSWHIISKRSTQNDSTTTDTDRSEILRYKEAES